MAKRTAKGKAMTAEMATVIHVHREVRDNWYIYTSDQLAGLYLASPDDRKAYDDLPAAIRELIRLESGVECRVVHVIDYREFQERMRLATRAVSAVAERTTELLRSGDISFVVECVRPDNAHA